MPSHLARQPAVRLTSLGIRGAAIASEVILILPRGKSVVDAQLMRVAASPGGAPIGPQMSGGGQLRSPPPDPEDLQALRVTPSNSDAAIAGARMVGLCQNPTLGGARYRFYGGHLQGC